MGVLSAEYDFGNIFWLRWFSLICMVAVALNMCRCEQAWSFTNICYDAILVLQHASKICVNWEKMTLWHVSKMSICVIPITIPARARQIFSSSVCSASLAAHCAGSCEWCMLSTDRTCVRSSTASSPDDPRDSPSTRLLATWLLTLPEKEILADELVVQP